MGYDIASFEPDATRIFIEVKTKRQGIDFPFLVSSNEVAVSEEKEREYRLYRVFDVSTRPSLYVTQGGLSARLVLRPTIYEARCSDHRARIGRSSAG